MSADDMSERDMARVDQALDLLREHFDTIQIFVSRNESGELDGTVTVHKGVGNWFARFGQVRAWMIKEEQSLRLEVKPDD